MCIWYHPVGSISVYSIVHSLRREHSTPYQAYSNLGAQHSEYKSPFLRATAIVWAICSFSPCQFTRIWGAAKHFCPSRLLLSKRATRLWVPANHPKFHSCRPEDRADSIYVPLERHPVISANATRLANPINTLVRTVSDYSRSVRRNHSRLSFCL